MSARTAIKICGLSEARHVAAAVDGGADYIGFVFFKPSPRNVTPEQARDLAVAARGKAKIVALTVDADDRLINAIAETLQPDLFQMHGSETPERVAEVTQRTGIPIIKAIKVREAADVEQARAYAGIAAMVLFDSKAPETLEGALPGGNGLAFDWSLLSGDGKPADFMLSGGLTADNVARAIEVTGAPIVDVSSGVETSPGHKDAKAIQKFIEAVRQPG
jgi:phosphoribosylanthranilate isomerase